MHKYGTIANRKMEMAKSLHLPQCIISSNSYLHACLKIIVFPVFVATHLHQHILYLSFILGVPEYDTTQTRIASWIFKEKCASKKPELQALPPVMPPNMPAPLYPWQLQPFWPFLLQMMATDALMFCSWAFCSCHAVLQFCDAGPWWPAMRCPQPQAQFFPASTDFNWIFFCTAWAQYIIQSNSQDSKPPGHNQQLPKKNS